MKKLKIQRAIIVLLVLAIIATCIANGILVYKTEHRQKPVYPYFEVLPYNHQYYALEYVETNLTKQDIRIILDMVYNVSYTYVEQDYLGDDIAGIAEANPNRITILDSLDIIDYITTLSHEISHLKYRGNETYTEYISLVTLYETNISLFQKVALNKARLIVSGSIYARTEYDCGYYLQKYFKNLL